MNAYANVYDLKMPKNYVGLTVDEMEYNGSGVDWFKIGCYIGIAIVCVVVPVAIVYVAAAVAVSATSFAVAAGASMIAENGGVLTAALTLSFGRSAINRT